MEVECQDPPLPWTTFSRGELKVRRVYLPRGGLPRKGVVVTRRVPQGTPKGETSADDEHGKEFDLEVVEEPEFVETGLLDASGVPLVRRNRNPIGYVWFE